MTEEPNRMRRLRLRDEEGVALVLAVLILAVLTIATISAISYTSASSRDASLKKSGQQAYALAEAGVNNALAQIGAQYPASSPSGTSVSNGATPVSYAGGTVTWQGTYTANPNAAAAAFVPGTWTVTATGSVQNPTRSGTIRRTVSASIDVTPSQGQTGAPPSWSYVYVKNNGAGCDLTLNNSVTMGSRLHMDGDLCLDNGATATGSPLEIGGQVWTEKSNTSIGTAAQGPNPAVPVDQLWIGNGCKYQNNAATKPCVLGAAPAGQNIFATNYHDATAAAISAPNADFGAMYNAIQPSASNPCRFGKLPSTNAGFETNAVKDNSVTLFDLAPASTSYSCTTPTGSLTWDLAAKKLTVSGVLYIDGNASIDGSGLTNKTLEYDGQGVIYLSGTMQFANQIKLCAVQSGGNCVNSGAGAWNPNTEFLLFAADGAYNTATGTCAGNPPSVPAGDSIQFQNSTEFQGGLYATCAVDVGQSAKVAGPIAGVTLLNGNSAQTIAFPYMTSIPFGTPGATVSSYTVGKPYAYRETTNP
jgi:Tfp pilus assembly protein PilX